MSYRLLPSQRWEPCNADIEPVPFKLPGWRHLRGFSGPARKMILPGHGELRYTPLALDAKEMRGGPPSWTINSLPDETLLEVFGHCLARNDSHGLVTTWQELAHVCHRWRQIVMESPNRLNLLLTCTLGTPVKDMITHSPPFPIILRYNRCCSLRPEDTRPHHPCPGWGAGDEAEIHFALSQHLARVQHLSLSTSVPALSRLTEAMNRSAPRLRYLHLESQRQELVLPKWFVQDGAPHLLEMQLIRVALHPGSFSMLSSATSLTSLVLDRIPPSAYIPPEVLVSHMVALSQLQHMHIGFISASPRPSTTPSRPLSQQPSEIPNLERISYRGASAYLEAVFALIGAPSLKHIFIQLFNELSYRTPHIARSSHRTSPRTRALTDATVFFDEGLISIQLYHASFRTSAGTTTAMNVACDRLDFQVAGISQICSSEPNVLRRIKTLRIDICARWPQAKWQDMVDPVLWRAFLAPFRGVITLTVSAALAAELGSALGRAPAAEEVLPELRVVQFSGAQFSGRQDSRSYGVHFWHFVDARKRAQRPVRVEAFYDSQRQSSCSGKHTQNLSVVPIPAQVPGGTHLPSNTRATRRRRR
ncbi:hypothetical protein BC834DRAFT_913179 [Gloeopeniophorella convolvens]|nr:hypothetical protein BC834DRAFT_913179 [Gloeopeniophorella convolvens]